MSDLLWTILFVGLPAGMGAASGSRIGGWCGGIIGFGLFWLVCTLNLRHFSRLLASAYRKPLPEDNQKAYYFNSSWEGDGEILDEDSKPLWRYKSIGGNIFRSQVYGFFRLPPFAVYDLEGRELVLFKRTKRFPFSLFEVKEGNLVVGTIRKQSLLSLLFTKYNLELADGLRCTFYMPRFTVWFHGTTKTGGRILVQLCQHRVWGVLLDSSIDNFHLVAAFAFIHRERLRSS
jgi:hypothetical protein